MAISVPNPQATPPTRAGRRSRTKQCWSGACGTGRKVNHRCPRCQEPCGTPTLLTSMVRYYSCAKCHGSSRVDRDLEFETWPSAELVSLLERPSSPVGDAPDVSTQGVPARIDLRTWDYLNALINRGSLTELGRSCLVGCARVWTALCSVSGNTTMLGRRSLRRPRRVAESS